MGDSATSKPPMLTRPEVGGMKPVIMRMVVDLPAPFGPRKPSTSPRSTLKEMPSTARFAPKAFTRLSMRIISAGIWGAAAGFQGCGLESSGRFSHKPKDPPHADVEEFSSRGLACARQRCGLGADVSGEAGAHHRAFRARRRLGL